MRILLIAGSFNSLTQRVHTALRDEDHSVAVHLVHGDEPLREAVRATDPDLIVAPMLTSVVPEDIWSTRTVLIVHPGPKGDRGPSSLDWAIHEGAADWGVTVLQAAAEMDAGDIWASVPFRVAPCSKSELYRGEVSDAAVRAVLLAVERFASGTFVPEPLDYTAPDVRGRLRPPLRQDVRRIDWEHDDTATVLRKLRAADSRPGVLDELYGEAYFLHGGHPEDELRGAPGTVLATRDGAICRATSDGAVWIPQLRPRRVPGGPVTVKLSAARVLGERLAGVPEVGVDPVAAADRETWSEIRYRELGRAGFLEFSFAGGAMCTGRCRRLLAAYRAACARPTSVLVLGPRRDFFSNGIHLGVIETAAHPGDESWENINAMDDLVHAVLSTTDRLTVAALPGNAAAGGLMLALAADEVWCRDGAVLNPHYRLMGLYGSEYWTYTLPRRVGTAEAERLTSRPLPVSAQHAADLGLIDRVLPGGQAEFRAEVELRAAALAGAAELPERVTLKRSGREREEAERPLDAYRLDELARMKQNFFGDGEPYPVLRREFVHGVRPGSTPGHLTAWLPAGA
ncbi:hydrogenase maturation protein [Streptomyces clavuligerus]|uniref:hydrogenase maturation protein n=1 Tax=Streptomyces clavuligerus TaxID=1901 RepID=UPI00081098CD|nr:hydrogenase maturation protein [Streptomyces clavuligerus]ANW16860.1 hydrogenase maturation protein [Streptomyces clavuligerus]AXU11389.1 hydrogenase maturation protein [Streptomyces clavuligerus]QPL61522.1 hydrogenase maturation protein [Streptomyces clavuligerus]QPL67562.1 hydrogenase maturation protein [Streptomyces clavuligerus]QPL73631.1 hydrogenase maturation protein [Streptomyces clavuligerus]